MKIKPERPLSSRPVFHSISVSARPHRIWKVATVFFCLILCVFYFFVPRANITLDLPSIFRITDEKPLVFIGGHPRSGTTLLRVLLDVHPSIRCGAETHILVKLLKAYTDMQEKRWKARMVAAKLYPGPLQRATAAFIYTLLLNAGPPADVLCNKDPLALLYASVLQEIFPTAKFIHMIRDGRAVTASMLKRNVTIGKVRLNEKGIFERWEKLVKRTLNSCGMDNPRCLLVRYEHLVLRPNETMHTILKFLNVPWDPVVLQHEMLVKNNTILSSMEPSTSQVVHPINIKSLDSWALNNSVLSKRFIHTAHENSTILKELGYADLGIPPIYGIPEPSVEKRTRQLMQDEEFRRIFN